MTNPTQVLDKFFAAYNAQDFDAMSAMLAPNVSFEHYNKGFAFKTRDELIATLRAFASTYMPDRKFAPAIRQNAAGNVVYREQVWNGTLAVDLPGFGKAGDKVSHRLCAVLTIGPEGTIVEYLDYG